MNGQPAAGTELSKALPSLKALVRLSNEQLSRIDTALLNLLCASALPGAEQMDIEALLQKLDDWVHEAKHQIRRNWYRFLADPADYENSAAYFHILVLITTLQRDLGVRYNPERATDPTFQDPRCMNPDFRDSRDLFIHGILDGPGGTCSSMPVLYTAACRRLGFPVYLVEAKDHLYCRWDDIHGQFFPRERFNIEGSGKGFGMYPDSHYEQWPLPLNEVERSWSVYGKCLSPRQELACFLTTRGHCLLDNGRRDEAIECFRWSIELAPHDKRYKLQLDSVLNQHAGRHYIPRRSPYPSGVVVKVPYGSPPPPDLPPGAGMRYVHATEMDDFTGWRPEPGRVYKVAAGRPLPACLPPGTPMRVVPANQADDLPVFRNAAKIPQQFPQFGRQSKPALGPNQGMSGISGPEGANSTPRLPGS
jgi:tetratricopeptide (TPR) repeat protein